MSHRNLVYFASQNEKRKKHESTEPDQKTLEKILESLAGQSMKEKAPTIDELEGILQSSIKADSDAADATQSDEAPKSDDAHSITKFLLESGYLKNEKNWLTMKGFLAIGNKILGDIMGQLKTGDFGLHQTRSVGSGTTVLDTTKKFEIGDELKLVSVPHTILNTINRLTKEGRSLAFPLAVDVDDFEQHETVEDVKASVVYCIDLSSTMKSSLADSGMSRIEAAKKALWALYILNHRFFPNDSVHIVGFASMASVVKPLDIPFLKTYDANDEFLHYTNYQAAFRLARKILQKDATANKRIVMITDGQPSACFVDNNSQKQSILSDKPYSNFYQPNPDLLLKIQEQKNMKIEDTASLVYLCYRYKKIDPKIEERTLLEAKKCRRHNIEIDSIVVSEETELLSYVQQMEKELRGRTYHISQNNMDKVLVVDYLSNTKRILTSQNL
ncbi:MAG: VWA domain-containing protein [Candidatus Nitrosotenuis sp.]